LYWCTALELAALRWQQIDFGLQSVESPIH